jgi:CheY-like chemotaxis protein/HPt (histidine-containing phosphotransfer) domain-containing protein
VAESQGVVEDDGSGALTGLRCRVVGEQMPLAQDLTAYLRYASVTVERFADLAAAAAAQSSGLWLWLVLPASPAPPLPEVLRQLTAAPGRDTRFVLLGWGNRRRPRLEAPDLVTIDADVLSRRMLFKALGLASGRLPAEALDREAEPEPGKLPALPEGASARNRLVLVAEDNETNRKVIREQLRLIGIAGEVVNDGREALEQWRNRKFDLLLTDLHMPLMDGYELAAAIRAEEPAGRRMPILALTANAQRDEERRCLAAGMDAYLTKPIRLAQLKTAIESWLDKADGTNALAHPPQAAAAPPADLAVLAQLVGTDPAVIAEVLQSFRRSAERSSRELVQGAADGAFKAVGDAAHKLKSDARTIGALRLGEICVQFEQAAQGAALEPMRALVAPFQAELDALLRYLDSH